MNQDIEESKEVTILKLRKELHMKSQQVNDLYVLIDTMQANMRAAETALDPEKKAQVTEVRSYKWCLNWRPGNELG